MHCLKVTFLLTLFITFFTANHISASVTFTGEIDRHVAIVQSSNGINLHVNIDDLIEHPAATQTGDFPQFRLEGEHVTHKPGMPVVPLLSRTLIVPPHAGIDLKVEGLSPTDSDNELFPLQPFTISDPFIIRGIRLVNVNLYPVQIDLSDNRTVKHEQLTATIQFTNSEPINPVELLPHKTYSTEFLSFIKGMISNDEGLDRDYDVGSSSYVKHYAIVTHEEALEYAIPLIEWKRQSGHKVDILSYGDEGSGNAEEIRNDLQFLYERYIENGEEPFDHILILGDRDPDENNEEVEWIVGSFEGRPSMQGLANHADFLFGDMENDDWIPDVAVGRFASGNQDLMELAVGRTLAYEQSPPLDERNCLDRVGIYTQHWSQTWNESINFTTTRWGYEVARHVGCEDIVIYEADPIEGDDNGGQIGPVLAEWLNNGLSLMMGRAENRYWMHRLQDVEVNDIHPIVFNTCAHGEFALYNLFRTGERDSLRGATAATSCWGDLSTVPNNALWMSMVNGVLLKDLTIGWGRNYSTLTLGAVFPGNQQQDIYEIYSTDLDLLGDPGLKPWIGIPQNVSAEFPESISTAPNQYVNVVINTADQENQPVSDAIVTLYISGELPDPGEYAEWEPVYMLSGKTDQTGSLSLLIEDELPEGSLTLTITGRDVYPLQEEINVGTEIRFVGVSAVDHGEDDGIYHPGEETNLSITATNYSEEDLLSVAAMITSNSPHLTIDDEMPIDFGEIASGRSVTRDIPQIQISLYCPDASKPSVTVNFDSQGEVQVGSSSIDINISAPDLEVSNVIDIVFGETEFDIQVMNSGSQATGPLAATLVSEDWSIDVLNREATYPNIGPGRAAFNVNGRFRIDRLPLAIPGSSAELLLLLRSESGFIDTAQFSVQVDTLKPNVPLGPDNYGYVCIDATDEGWSPTDFRYLGLGRYNTTFRGEIIEFGDDVTDTAYTIDLDSSFTFRFYGEEYDQLTVCINGFISPGEQLSAVNYQSYPMELGVGGGVGIIAPFWHHLTLDGDNYERIYHYYHEPGHYMIIEWHNAHYHSGQRGQDLRFQVKIYDPSYYPTPTGDSEIEFYYRDVFLWAGHPQEGETPYPTVGLSSPHGDTGLTYSFKNRSPLAADSIRNRRILKFTTIPKGNPELELDRSSLNEREMLRPDHIAVRPIKLKNEGTGSLAYNVSTDRRRNWLSIEPTSGRMMPDDSLDLIFTINTAGLTDDTTFNDTVNVTITDGWEKFYTIPVIINVDEGNEIDSDEPLPLAYSLSANFPNPFNSTTEISYSLKEQTHVILQIHDLSGRLVETLVDGHIEAGHHSVVYDALDVSSGIYFYSIKTESFSSVRKMILLR